MRLFKYSRRKLIAITIGVLVLMAPILICFFLFWWPDIRVRWDLRLYPNTKQVGEAYGYYGGGVGWQVLYYWTKDSAEDVQHYYEKFTFPFTPDAQGNGLLTIFSLDGSELVYHSVDGISHKLNYPSESYCHHSQVYKCANIRIMTINSSGLDDLPVIVSLPRWTNVTPSPSGTTLASGTLIIYSYYKTDFWD